MLTRYEYQYLSHSVCSNDLKERVAKRKFEIDKKYQRTYAMKAWMTICQYDHVSTRCRLTHLWDVG